MEPKNYPLSLNSYTSHRHYSLSENPLIISDVVQQRPPSPLILSMPLLPMPPLLTPSRISAKYIEQSNINPIFMGLKSSSKDSIYKQTLTLRQFIIKKKLLNHTSKIIPQNPFKVKELINFMDNFFNSNSYSIKEKFISGNACAHLIDQKHPFADVDLFYMVEIDHYINKHTFLDNVLICIIQFLHQILKNNNIILSFEEIEKEILNNKFKAIDEKNCYAQYKLNGIDLLIAVYDSFTNKPLMERSNVNGSFRLCLLTNTISCYDVNGYCDKKNYILNEIRFWNRLFIVNQPEKVFKLHFRILLAWYYGYEVDKDLLPISLKGLHKELRNCPFKLQKQYFNFIQSHFSDNSYGQLINFLNQCTFIGLEEDYEQKIRSIENYANLFLMSLKNGSYPEIIIKCALLLKNNPEHCFRLITLLHVTLFINFLKNNKKIKCYTSSSEFFDGSFCQRSSFSIQIKGKTYYLFVPYGPKFILSHFFKYIHEYKAEPSFNIFKYAYDGLLSSLKLISPFTSDSLNEVSKLIVDPFYFNNIIQFQNGLNIKQIDDETINIKNPFIEIPINQFIVNLKNESQKFSLIPNSFKNALILLNIYALEENFVKQRSSKGVQFTFLLRQCHKNKNYDDETLKALHRLITIGCEDINERGQVKNLLKNSTIQNCFVKILYNYLKKNPFNLNQVESPNSFQHLIEGYFLKSFQKEYFISWVQALNLHYKENKCPFLLDTLGRHCNLFFSKEVNHENSFDYVEMKLVLDILNAYLEQGKIEHMKGVFERISLILKMPQFGQKFPLIITLICQKFSSLIFIHKLSKKKEIPFDIGLDLLKILPISYNSEFLSYIIYIIKLYHDTNQFQKKYRIKLIELLISAEKLQPIKNWSKYKYQSLIKQFIQTKNVLFLRWVCYSIFKASANKNEVDHLLIEFVKEISSIGDNNLLLYEFLNFICKRNKYRNPILNLKLLEYYIKSPQKEMMKVIYQMISGLLIEFKTNPPSYQLRHQIFNQLTFFWKKLCAQEKNPQLNLECMYLGFWLLSKEKVLFYFKMLDVTRPNTWPTLTKLNEWVLNHFQKGKMPIFLKNLIEISLSSQDQKVFTFICNLLIQYREYTTHEILYILLEEYNNLPYNKQGNLQLFEALNNLICQLPSELFKANNYKEKTIFEDTLITIYSLIDNEYKIELNRSFLFVGDTLLNCYLNQINNPVFIQSNEQKINIHSKDVKGINLNIQEQSKAFRKILSTRYGSLSKTEMSSDLLETYNKDCIELFKNDWQKMLALDSLYENICRLRIANTELVVKHFLDVLDKLNPHFIPLGRKIFLNLCDFLDKNSCISTDGVPAFKKMNKMPFFIQQINFINKQEQQQWNTKREYDILLFNNLFVAFYLHKYYFNYTSKEFNELNQDLTESYIHLHQTISWNDRMDLSNLFRVHRLFITHSTFWFLKTGDFFILELLFNNLLEYAEKTPQDFSSNVGKLVHMAMTKIIQFSLLICDSLELNVSRSSDEAIENEKFEFNPFANQTPKEVGYSINLHDLIESKFLKLPHPKFGENSKKLLSFSLLLLEKLPEERKKELSQPKYLKPLFEKVIFYSEQYIKLKNCKTLSNKPLIKDSINFVLKATRNYIDVDLLQRLLKCN